LADGSWGALEPIYHHDRVLSTLAALIALVRNGAPEDIPRISAALPALHFSLANLHQDVAGRTIGFEMLLPALVAEARSLGLNVNDSHGVVGAMSRARDAKIAQAPEGLIDRYTTLGFSIEMVGSDGIHLLDVHNLQQADGSVCLSPAATAFFATSVYPDPAALEYLQQIALHGGAPPITAIDIFETAWALWNFAHGSFIDATTLALCHPLLCTLARAWRFGSGVAHADCFSVPDGDDTGVVYEVLARYHHAPDLESIWYYEERDHFRCFDLESHPSTSTNIHILGALRQASLHVSDPRIRKIVRFLHEKQEEGGYWVDKWHVSPYYPTAHAVIACAGYLNEIVEPAVDWILATQNLDGSWGYYFPTAEETAYCLQALMTWHQHGLPVPRQALTRGIAWLAEHTRPPYPPMWISKSLKCPVLVVQSAILAALWQYQSEYGSLP
jgi:halimadienyl-diphosphate synthase